jgi:hypothetical protein
LLGGALEGKLANTQQAALAKCSADAALRDINDLLAHGTAQAAERWAQHGV